MNAIAEHVGTEIISYRDALMRTMREGLAEFPQTIILGQGVNDHKGTFGTTMALADEFGADRVMDMPLCEDATTGIAVGAALCGLYPIHVHIRADFVLLAMNQIINMAAKYRYMSDGHLECPLLIRLVVGRSWGQGAQHSQSLQSLFAHVPGLTVVMPANAQSVLDTYRAAIGRHRGPVISLEHRLLYDIRFETGDGHRGPGLTSRKVGDGRHVTVVATSIMVLEAQRAAQHLRQYGIEVDIIDLHSPSHPDTAMILESVAKTGKLLVADSSWIPYGVSAEVARMVSMADPTLLKAPMRALGMQPAPCPTAKWLEDRYYPNLRDMVDEIARLATGKADHGIPLPTEQSMADVYKKFKGPF